MPIYFALWFGFTLALALGYAVLIFRLVAVWRSMPALALTESDEPDVFLSVIIPARNEEASIRPCLEAIADQDYPVEKYEVLVVDDHSNDRTAERVRRAGLANLQLLRLADYPQLNPAAGHKKQAITWAMEHARGELIVTTDADCVAPPGWLRRLATSYRREDARFIAAPVVFSPTRSLLEDFQALDFLGMMLLTGAGIQTGWYYMSNGANLAYPKAVFHSVSGFDGIQDIASGDDMLLLHKIVRQSPAGIHFIKSREATVRTAPQPTLRTFVRQRLRWATKSNRYADWRVTAFLALVFLLCWSILLSLPAFFIWGLPAFLVGFVILFIKSVADYQLLSTAARFFGQSHLLKRFWPAQFMHILYVALIGLLANVWKRYEWKGRRVR